MSHRLRTIFLRSGIVLAVMFVAFIASGVILAQSSENYDLGCRSVMSAGGYAADYETVGVILHSSFGEAFAGRTAIQGSGIILESGFILPVAQTDAALSSSSVDATAIGQNPLYLPAIYANKVIRYVRPCNWSWAPPTQVAQ